MIISISLKNFFSIKEEAVLDFTADLSARYHREFLSENLLDFKNDKFLNILGLFGGNAAGKSNIIKAIEFCRFLILSSHTFTQAEVLDFTPFKFDTDKPSEFYINFVLDDIEYEYSFSIKDGIISKENLFYYPNKRKAKIYTRIYQDFSFGKGVLARPNELALNTGSKTLLLSRASVLNRPIAQKIYQFFHDKLLIGLEQADFSRIDPVHFDKCKDLLLTAFEVSDSDIVDIRLETDEQGKRVLKSFHKENPSIPFDFEKEESEGTKRLLFILLRILKSALNGATFFLDEFDLKLHLRLAEFILDLIRATHSAQLVFTSHNPSLINNEKLRPEQIILVTKLQNGNSEFIPLSDYVGIKPQSNLQQAYLQGRFDAVPYIGQPYSLIEKYIRQS